MISHSRFRVGFSCLSTWLILLIGSPGPVAGATDLARPQLVVDFTPGAVDSKVSLEPKFFSSIEGLVYFSGTDAHGAEPWVSDGTVAGTRRLADLCPGPCSSNPISFTQLGGQILFVGGSGDLYRLVGGEIELVARFGASDRYFAKLGSILYVATRTGGLDRFYRTDGTRQGTRPSGDFCPSSPSCIPPDEVGRLGDSIYFVSQGWLYRLLSEGKPLAVRPMAHSARHFFPLDANRILFQGCEEGFDCHAWVSDGTFDGSIRLEDSSGTLTQRAAGFKVWRGRAYFRNGDDQMVSTDGTIEGTRLESFFIGRNPTLLAATASHLFYFSTDTETNPGTRRVYAVNSVGIQNELLLLSPIWDPFRIGALGDKIFLRYEIDNLQKIVSTDGDPTHTTILSTSPPDSPSSDGVASGSSFYFGRESLWRTDGTLSGTEELELHAVIPFSSSTRPFRLGHSLIVDSAAGIWRYDPQTLQGVNLDTRPLQIVLRNDDFLYASSTESGTPLFAVHEDGVTETAISNFHGAALAADGHLFLTSEPGQRMLESDGTSADIRELFDLEPGYVACTGSHFCRPSVPTHLTPSAANVFFVAKKPGLEVYQLWVWDRQRPTLLLEPFPVADVITALPDGRVAFVGGYDSAWTPEFWLSDGTPAGTYPFFNAGPVGQGVLSALPFGQRLAIVFYTGGYWLWASDLTSTGTFPLAPEPYYQLEELVAAGGHLFFSGSGTLHEEAELGFSDGTPQGTHWLDIRPGIDGAKPHHLFALEDRRVVFAAAGDSAGEELWISDGTLAGTYRLTDLAPGAESSSPSDFAQVGNRLFFQASDGLVGRELWALDLPPLSPCTEDQVCLMGGRFEVEVEAKTQDGVFRGHRVTGSADSGVFTFFSADNWEMLVKVLDGCANNGHRWVFAAAATDVGYTLSVYDRETGVAKVYTNPPGQPAVAVTDTAAFSCN